MDNNIVNVKLQEYQPVSSVEKLDRGGWVAFGVNNLFPQYLRELSESSPVHGSLCISIGDMIAGKGITSNLGQDRVEALDVYGQYYAASHDFKKYGGYFVEVIYSNDRKSIAKLRHLPFEECRIAVEGEDEVIIGIYHSEDWANTRKKKNRPTFISKFNPSMAAQEPSQVLWRFTYTSGQIYPNPDYWSAVNYIELERQIGIYHVNNILNGLFPSFIISFFNGQIPPDQQWDMKNDWERLLTGARNAGKFLMTFNERDTPKPDITAFPLSDADKQYTFLSEESTNKVMIAHRITTPLIFGIRTNTGFGSNKDEMAIGLEIFNNQVIEPAQRLIIRGFTEILSFEIPNIQLTVVPNTPLAFQQAQPVQQSAVCDCDLKKKEYKLAEGSDDLSESEVAEELIALGEDWDEDMILIDTYEVDYDTDDAENHDLEMITAHELASTGTANPAFPSEQDEVIKGKLFMTRYVYRGVLSDNTREFCSKMLKADKLYRKEDIIAMGNRAVNKAWGPNGANTYDIWLYKGGGHCNHFWQKAVFMSAKGGNINPRGKDAQSIAVKKAEGMGYKVRNEALVAKLPTDMDYHGFLPTNPVWGANGSAYK